MSDRQAKSSLYDAFAAVAQSLANGRRAELVDVLAQGERSVEDAAAEIGQSVANTSQHLRVLARAGVATSRRLGNRVLYRLAGDRVEALWEALRAVAAEHVAGLDRLAADYLGDRSDLEQVDRQELARRLADDDLVLWDVRPPTEFVAGHVPGAVSVPPAEIRRRLDDVPDGTDVVAYCRGPFCVFADDAVRELTARGHRALRLEDGFPEWRRAGLPVAVGE
ncbi:MAG TPA: metalloregulator ArsR/SmtB family transcription factor [Acidimicrobiales bacterium]|nr:metalloregulator ArsR/SmtB family transcription factor [Acidimicrobiales bacterium]